VLLQRLMNQPARVSRIRAKMQPQGVLRIHIYKPDDTPALG
jgi:hypothetical protein